jgi:hypothetical protein
MVSVAGAMTSETGADLVWDGFAASVTVVVKLKVPLAVGVPETMPVVAPMLRPDGRLPEVTAQV